MPMPRRDYALKDRDSDGVLEYAQKFMSAPGKKDGLYWETKEGEQESPLGPLFAAAQERGYKKATPGGKPVPYYGYYYRILKAQGKSAPGGAYDYVVNGRMIGRVCPRCLSRSVRLIRRHDLHREPGWHRLPEEPGQEHAENRRGHEGV